MDSKERGLNIIGYTQGEFGLGEALRLNIKAAQKFNIPVHLIDYQKVKKDANYKYTFKYTINLVQISLRDIDTFFGIIDSNLFKSKYTILYLIWESEYIAPELAENLNLFNEIWTASKYCKDIFQQVYDNPIIIIPHPIELKLESIHNMDILEFFDENKFSFLFIFSYHSSIERKNPFFLIEAFSKAFGDNKNVELIIKTNSGEQFKKSERLLKLSVSKYKNIKIFDINLDKNDLNFLINNCDCYVSTHHSEGFGLTLAEAMYFGKPTIATNYSGNTEFMNDSNSFLVDYELGLIENPDANFCPNTRWANPIMHDTVQKLIEVFKNEELRTYKAKNASRFVRDKLSFYSVGCIIKNRLSHLYDNFDEGIVNENQNIYFINQLQIAKAEISQLQREIRKMKKNVIIRFILVLKETTRKIKKEYKVNLLFRT